MPLAIDELEINTQFDQTSQVSDSGKLTQKEIENMREDIIRECLEKVEAMMMKRERR